MVDALQLYEKLSKTFEPEAAQTLAEVLSKAIEEEHNHYVRREFESIRQALAQLTSAQARTEEQLNRLTVQIDQLAQAQRRTEERLNQLAEAQRKTEERLNHLTERVDQLAEAQRRTEERLNQLAEAQRKTEERLDRLTERVDQLAEAQRKTEERLNRLTERVDQLAEAQRKTEEQIQKLTGEMIETRQQLGGLSMTVGYMLENEAIWALPKLLEQDYGLKVIEPLRRGFVKDEQGREFEVNILGRARQDGETVWLIGEAKARLSKNDINRFVRRRLKILEPVLGKIFPILVTHMVSSSGVEAYARQLGIALYYSYQFRRE